MVVDVPGVPTLPGLQRPSANAAAFTLYDEDLPAMARRLERAYGPPSSNHAPSHNPNLTLPLARQGGLYP